MRSGWHENGTHEGRHVALVHACTSGSVEEDRLALHTIEALHDAGHRVTVVLPERSPFGTVAEGRGLGMATLPCEPPNRSLPWDSIARIGGACGLLWSRRIKLVHCTSPGPVATLLPAARMLKIPLLSQVHTVPSDGELDHTLCRFADLLMPSSERVEALLIDYLRRRRTHSVHHIHRADPGLDFPDRSSTERGMALRKKADVSKDALIIAMVAELNPGKGCDLLFEAIQLIARRGLRPPVWIGVRDRVPPGGRSLEALVRLARNLGIDEQVRFLDATDDCAAVLAAADIVAVPSRIDHLGMTAREAMLANCAVVASRTGALADAIRHGETGLLVPPVDPASLARALFRLLVDFELRTGLIRKGRAHGLAHFSREPYAARLIEGHEIAAGNAPDHRPSPPPRKQVPDRERVAADRRRCYAGSGRSARTT